MKYVWMITVWLLLGWSCRQTGQITGESVKTIKPRFAEGFELLRLDSLDILSIKNAYPDAPLFRYILQRNNQSIPDSLQKYPVIKIPVQKILVTSTTHLPALEMLGVSDKLAAFPHTKYISSPVFRRLVDSRKIKEVAKGNYLNTEAVLAVHPDLIMRFSSGNDFLQDKVFIQNQIPVLYNGDWTETDPLGRAEWIKVFGYLFQKESEATQIFDSIAGRYQKIKKRIKSDSIAQPLVFQGGLFGDKWFVPGGRSYAAQLIHDAGGRYIWEDDTHSGSINLNFENVLLRMPRADIWLNPGMYENRQVLRKDFSAVSEFKVYKNRQIYTYNLTKGETGGVWYFEQSNAHPDWVLDDLYHIFYPADSTYKFHFYSILP